jgi:trehalose 6-phosphate phosphatase
MRDVLARNGVALLERYAKSRLLLAFDFDGTLAPIVADRYVARMRKRTRALLSQLATLYPCVVISGRSRRDTRNRTKAAHLHQVIGNHGLEPGNTARFAREIASILPELQRLLRGVKGIDIENKRLSLAIHYRQARSRRGAREAIDRAVAELSIPVRVITGKLLVNVVPRGAPNKGQALMKLKRQLRAPKVLYVGDDVTDEDVFRLKQSGLLTIRVGRSKASAATHFLRNQGEIDRLLKKLIELRAPAPDMCSS